MAKKSPAKKKSSPKKKAVKKTAPKKKAAPKKKTSLRMSGAKSLMDDVQGGGGPG
jgi:hypothetical protein